MQKNYYQGTMITVELPKNQYKGYVVDCVYRYVKDMNKYALSMWLRNTEVDDRMQICSQEINTQYITSTRENIKKLPIVHTLTSRLRLMSIHRNVLSVAMLNLRMRRTDHELSIL